MAADLEKCRSVMESMKAARPATRVRLRDLDQAAAEANEMGQERGRNGSVSTLIHA
jgi:hypothetical protein